MARNHLAIASAIGLSLIAMASCRPAAAGATVTPCSASQPNAPGGCEIITNGAAHVAPTPTADASSGVAENAAPAAAASYPLKTSAGNAYTVSAVNLTANPGFLVVIDAASAPADGPITPIGCAPLAGSSPASLVWGEGSPPVHFNVGLVAVLTSAATCYTKTTGTITGFISGQVQ